MERVEKLYHETYGHKLEYSEIVKHKCPKDIIDNAECVCAYQPSDCAKCWDIAREVIK